jgi:hypothetical protein
VILNKVIEIGSSRYAEIYNNNSRGLDLRYSVTYRPLRELRNKTGKNFKSVNKRLAVDEAVPKINMISKEVPEDFEISGASGTFFDNLYNVFYKRGKIYANRSILNIWDLRFSSTGLCVFDSRGSRVLDLDNSDEAVLFLWPSGSGVEGNVVTIESTKYIMQKMSIGRLRKYSPDSMHKLISLALLQDIAAIDAAKELLGYSDVCIPEDGGIRFTLVMEDRNKLRESLGLAETESLDEIERFDLEKDYKRMIAINELTKLMLRWHIIELCLDSVLAEYSVGSGIKYILERA